MNNAYIWIWTVTIFLSISWYAAMLFYVGVKGGHEILEMTKNLSKMGEDDALGVAANTDT